MSALLITGGIVFAGLVVAVIVLATDTDLV